MGFALALTASAAAVLSGLAYRMEALSLTSAFTLLRWGAYIALAAAVVSLAGLVAARPGGARRGLVLALIGLVVGLSVFWVPFNLQRLASRVPAIHDITTDTHNPPDFVALYEIRSAAPNGHAYGGRAVADQQESAYPDIRPLRLAAPPAEAFDDAVAAAGAMGWQIIAVSESKGRIEATDTTLWFGFKDDIVIRVAPHAGGSVVDVRSASRVGRSDLGKNAERIRAFMARLRSHTGAAS